MKYLLILSFLFYSALCQAQPYFVDTLKSTSIMSSVFELPNSQGYAVSTFENYKFNLIYTDLEGHRTGQQSWRLFDTLICSFFTRTATKMPNGNYAVAVLLKNPTTPVYYGGIIMLNSTLTDTLWCKRYTYTTNNYTTKGQNLFYVKAAPNGTFWALGNVGLDNNNLILPLWLVHLDANGAVISQNHYPLTYSNQYPNALIPTPDGGCLIGTVERPANSLQSTQQVGFLKVNAAGQQEWYKQYGALDKRDTYPFVLRAANPNEYWLVYTEGTNTSTTNFRVRIKGIRVNSIGTELQVKYLAPYTANSTEVYDAYQDADGSVIFGMKYLLTNNSNYGHLWKFSPNMDSLWRKQLPAPNYNNNTYEGTYPYHIIKTTNSDIITSGIYYLPSGNDAIFITRLDSAGCLVVGTENATQADEMQIKVFPNPTNNNTHIEWNENLQSPIKIEIINSVGQAIETIKIENNTTYQDINTKNLPNGIYYLTLYDKNNLIHTTKFVVLHE